MSEALFKLKNAPIVEAVLDIDCAFQPGFKIKAVEKQARDAFAHDYPSFRPLLFQEHELKQETGAAPKMIIRRGVQSFQFRQADQLQLIQIRTDGYSFNRLSPYSSLDDYLPEIEKTWAKFVEITKPVQIRRLVLRYINRILLPMDGEKLELNNFIKISPQLPMEDELTFLGFLNQYTVEENRTRNIVNLTMTIQKMEKDHLPFILDISAIYPRTLLPDHWPAIGEKVSELRGLKNRVFRNTLTERCLSLFQ
jgi:uncharacterized protein (TIGR04255 family)